MIAVIVARTSVVGNVLSFEVRPKRKRHTLLRQSLGLSNLAVSGCLDVWSVEPRFRGFGSVRSRTRYNVIHGHSYVEYGRTNDLYGSTDWGRFRHFGDERLPSPECSPSNVPNVPKIDRVEDCGPRSSNQCGSCNMEPDAGSNVPACCKTLSIYLIKGLGV